MKKKLAIIFGMIILIFSMILYHNGSRDNPDIVSKSNDENYEYQVIYDIPNVDIEEQKKVFELSKYQLGSNIALKNENRIVESIKFKEKKYDEKKKRGHYLVERTYNVESSYYEGYRKIVEYIEVGVNEKFTQYDITYESVKTIKPYPILTEEGAEALLKKITFDVSENLSFKKEDLDILPCRYVNNKSRDDFYTYRAYNGNNENGYIVIINKNDLTAVIQDSNGDCYSLAKYFKVYNENHTNVKYSENELIEVLEEVFGESNNQKYYKVHYKEPVKVINNIQLYKASMTTIQDYNYRSEVFYIGNDSLVYDYNSIENGILKLY